MLQNVFSIFIMRFLKKQTISKILKRSRYKLVKKAGKSFAEFVSRNWLIIANNPKMADKTGRAK